MSSTTDRLRNKLYDYIRVADDKKIQAMFHLLEHEIEETMEWWENKSFVTELDRRYEDLESGKDKGITVEQMAASIDKVRKKRYDQ